MYEDKIVLCGANSYEQKYYLNPDFETLPESVKNELKIMCVLFTEDVGGVLTLVFEENGELCFEVSNEENDFFFDEIGSHLKIKELQRTKEELLESLQLYYKQKAIEKFQFSSVQFSRSVVSNFCDPMDCSTPGLPVHHQLPEFTQTHAH